jgi:hypothetical protein
MSFALSQSIHPPSNKTLFGNMRGLWWKLYSAFEISLKTFRFPASIVVAKATGYDNQMNGRPHFRSPKMCCVSKAQQLARRMEESFA